MDKLEERLIAITRSKALGKNIQIFCIANAKFWRLRLLQEMKKCQNRNHFI